YDQPKDGIRAVYRHWGPDVWFICNRTHCRAWRRPPPRSAPRKNCGHLLQSAFPSLAPSRGSGVIPVSPRPRSELTSCLTSESTAAQPPERRLAPRCRSDPVPWAYTEAAPPLPENG